MLYNSKKFEEALESAKQNKINLIFGTNFNINNSTINLKHLKNIVPTIKSVGIFIGPEGGWDSEEIKLARENNFEIVSLAS